jgi:hypothetical protein
MPILLNQLRQLALSAAFCVVWFNAAVSMPAEALSTRKKTVLVLHGERLSILAMRTTEQGLMAGLSHGQPEDLEIFSVYLDLARFTAAQYGDDLVRHLRARHAPRKPKVLIAIGSSALKLPLAHRDELFVGVRIVFANVDHREVKGREMPPHVTELWMASMFNLRRTEAIDMS